VNEFKVGDVLTDYSNVRYQVIPNGASVIPQDINGHTPIYLERANRPNTPLVKIGPDD